MVFLLGRLNVENPGYQFERYIISRHLVLDGKPEQLANSDSQDRVFLIIEMTVDQGVVVDLEHVS